MISRRLFIALFMFTALLLSGWLMLWLVHHTLASWQQFTSFLLILVIYFNTIIACGWLNRTLNLKQIHRILGLYQCRMGHLTIATIMALLLWSINMGGQWLIVEVDLSQQALNWRQKQSSLYLSFLATVVLTPMVEELLFRGLLLQELMRNASRTFAILIVSALFAVVHFDGVQTPMLFIASAGYCLLTIHSKSLWPAIIAHVLNNVMTFTYLLHLSSQS